MQRKSFTPDVEADGHVKAIIATLNVKDHDGDVTLPGAFGRKEGIPLLVGHQMHGLPVGKGRVYEEGHQAVFEGQFNLGSQHGKDAYETVKFMGMDGDWSYGYTVKAHQRGHISENGKSVPVRFLKSLDVLEASIVGIGAGVGTGTASVKERTVAEARNLIDELADAGDENAIRLKALLDSDAALNADETQIKFTEQAEAVVTAVGALTKRAKDIVSLRKGRKLGTDSVERLSAVAGELGTLVQTLELITSGTEIPETDDLRAESMRFQRYLARQNGVSV